MAAANLLALIDDIAALLDDIAMLTKVAGKKTAGVLGDDLALNAQQVAGIKADRELPVVWAVAKGSFKNKFILVPSALLISAFAPWAIIVLLMLGGAYLCYEGFEKIAHKFFGGQEDIAERHKQQIQALRDPAIDMVEFEKQKIKGAIRTDFILSAEIVVISLGVVKDASFAVQVAVVSGLAVAITIGVYGIVAAIVKLDDAGLHLITTADESLAGRFKMLSGRGLLVMAPYLMKLLSVVGTIAMFLVGGGILLHGVPGSHEWLTHVGGLVSELPALGSWLAVVTPVVANLLAGLIVGGVVLLAVKLGQRFMGVSAG